jgi:hypothetical protein
MNIPDPNDSWAQVELYRWQHGELPPQDKQCKNLHVPTAIRAMANALESGLKSGDMSNAPSPFNGLSVMRYSASVIQRSKNKK